jgi:Na+/proline symporter
MSTVATQLNWGASYLVADFYRRFVKKNASEKHYVIASRLATVLLVIASAWISVQLTSIGGGWQVVLEIGAGTGLVYLLRWYWWRINAWSEISAMATSLLVSVLLNWKGLWRSMVGTDTLFSGSGPVVFAKTALTTTIITTVAWVTVTFLTNAEPESVLVSFYRKTRPDTRGWQPIARLTPDVAANRDLGRNLIAWLLGCAMVYLALFGLGKVILHQMGLGIALLVGSVLCAVLLYMEQSRRGWGAEQKESSATMEHVGGSVGH